MLYQIVTHTCMHSHTHTHMLPHTHTHMLPHTHTHICYLTHTHMLPHTHTHTHMLPHTHTYATSHTYTYTYAASHTYTHICYLTHIHTHTYATSHTYTHTYATSHTYTHTYTYARSLCRSTFKLDSSMIKFMWNMSGHAEQVLRPYRLPSPCFKVLWKQANVSASLGLEDRQSWQLDIWMLYARVRLTYALLFTSLLQVLLLAETKRFRLL